MKVSAPVDPAFEADVEHLCDLALRAGEHVLREFADVRTALSDEASRRRFEQVDQVGD